ncbi:uncharacterized protein L199_003165 [Kwoniella botswanensis]|uniref:uncharacterized protein n=1 Tax=Kwoniella botswanensis TaxID=1268659 RepID=UPI00315D62CF
MASGQSPSKGYINAPPGAQPGMSATTTAAPSERRVNDSENSSLTAVDDHQHNNRQMIPGLSLTSSPSSTTNHKDGRTKYEQWYPGDASHNGRPAWWNKWFCCGYGLGCLLCPCSSWNCKHERS